MKRIKSNYLIIVGILLILGAVGLTIYNGNEEERVEEKTKEIEEMLEEYIFHLDEHIKYDEKGNPIIDSEYFFEGFDPSMYLGILEIPYLNLRLPVSNTFSMEQMLDTPCLYSGSIEDENLVIGAHNYTAHLGSIRYGKEGQIVYLYDIEGTRHKYIIDGSENLSPEQQDELIHSDYELTLFTCTYYGYLRVAIRCYEVLE